MKSRRNTTLRSEIVASTALLAAVAVVLVGALVALIFQAEHIEKKALELERTATFIATSLQDLLVKGSESKDSIAQAKALLSKTVDDGIQLVWLDQRGDILWSNVDQHRKDYLKSLAGTSQAYGQGDPNSAGKRAFWPLIGEKVLTQLNSLFVPGLGKTDLLAAVSVEGAWEILQKRGWFLPIYVATVMIVIIGFGSYLLSKNVIGPIRKIMEASERIASGQYEGLRWEEYPPHEIGRLAKGLDAMAQGLKEKQEALEAKLRELEEANRALIQAQEAMIRSEKLATVGRLAAGVAHEIGNPIGSILGYVDLLLERIQGSLERECLERLKGEAERIRRTLRALLDIGRSSGKSWERVDIVGAVDEAVSVIKGHPSMRGVRLIWEPPSQGDLNIWADPDQVKQVLLNLLLNAMDAVEKGGEIRISVGAAEKLPSSEEIFPPPRRRNDPQDKDFRPLRKTSSLFGLGRGKGPFVFIEVKDTGRGISEEQIPLIFEPFYTTKEPGKGTGLGLSVCLGIVESYGGKIEVRSESGKGTIFKVFLPKGSPGGHAAQREKENTG